MYTILGLIVVVILVSLGVIYVAFKCIHVSEANAKLITLAGELCLVLSAVLFFLINTNVLGSYKNSDLDLIKESLKQVEIRLIDIERNQHLEEPNKNFHSFNTISEMEESIEYSKLQVIIAEWITLFLSTLGSIFLFVGKICTYKIFLEKRQEKLT
ncbi:hypothetical protein [Enterococcus durans]|uniref:hypothetical protein n=1 Tax=Enterococcus durans TaxID=53345 RepID=UPI000BA8B8B2|nr:hypothetical protein [Enterococcus durans]ASV95256.1 hypothetical protein CJZ72_06630 [Enterococcus durans]MBX9039936.1 hypothetical protein [Enterococcus durans]MBX9079075.1 hypothetical protein [Enterococcus durans]MCB8504498.1 hypothetical protein [Enterococcus durans]